MWIIWNLYSACFTAGAQHICSGDRHGFSEMFNNYFCLDFLQAKPGENPGGGQKGKKGLFISRWNCYDWVETKRQRNS